MASRLMSGAANCPDNPAAQTFFMTILPGEGLGARRVWVLPLTINMPSKAVSPYRFPKACRLVQSAPAR